MRDDICDSDYQSFPAELLDKADQRILAKTKNAERARSCYEKFKSYESVSRKRGLDNIHHHALRAKARRFISREMADKIKQETIACELRLLETDKELEKLRNSHRAWKLLRNKCIMQIFKEEEAERAAKEAAKAIAFNLQLRLRERKKQERKDEALSVSPAVTFLFFSLCLILSQNLVLSFIVAGIAGFITYSLVTKE